ncbi:hypothetical protein D9615_000766 [Tricholomella constricta]|uniref:Arrestin-like N-terminal domain-containing protein n=1 Tax=Tricholomella constricta TaxID=117010 RepID=A0A8H5MB72_9AGAR|nr:hypothetical protein D9615_000766 [Tricholomella constricta]
MPSDAPPVYSRTGSPVSESASPDVLEAYQESPRYSKVFALHGRPTPASRSSHPLRTPHTFTLQSSKTPWITLKCISRAGSPTNTPKYEGRDQIAGSIKLDLTGPMYINVITISVRGRIITAGTEEGSYTFLDDTHILWSKAQGDPRHASSMRSIKLEGKMAPGEYSWDFSFPFPGTIATVVESRIPPVTKAHTTPQSFLEHGTSVTVQYELVLHVGRGALRPDRNIIAPIIYTPRIVPDPPSALRQLAYREASPLMEPIADPDGWLTLASVAVLVKRSPSQDPVEIKCKLSIAKPLCYARGTVIPCTLTLRCPDAVALDAIALPDAIKVALQRRVKYCQKGARQTLRKPITETLDVQDAVWWASMDDATYQGDDQSRTIQGEIHLHKNLQPSSDLPSFTVEYLVVFLPFCSPAFVCDNKKTPLATQLVTIGTFPPRGPRTREYSTRMNTDYSSSRRDPVVLARGFGVNYR